MASSSVNGNIGYKYEIGPFNGNNYHSWRFQMKMVLMSKGIWVIINGNDAEPEGNGVTDRDKKIWRHRQ